MSKPLRVLIVEDSEDDTELLLRELRRSDYDLTHERVETAPAMRAALARQPWDLVIADYSMPHFSAPAALALLKESGFDLPFIIVSGTIGEERAVAAMKTGAHDYLIKGHLARLVPVIERELREARIRWERRQAEAALQDRERYFRALIENISDVIATLDASGRIIYVSPALTRVLGYTPAEHIGHNAFDLLHPNDLQANEELFGRFLQQPGAGKIIQFRAQHKDGSWRWLEATIRNLLHEPAVQAVVTNLRDITGRKQVEETLRINKEHQASLLRLARQLEQAQTFPSVLEAALAEVKVITGYQNIWAFLLAEDKETMSLISIQGELTGVVQQKYPILRVQGDRMLEEIAAGGQPVIVEDARTDPRTNKEVVAQLQNRTIINVPMMLGDRKIGTLGTGSFADEGVRLPNKHQLDYLVALASHVSVTFHRIEILTQRQRAEETLAQERNLLRTLIDHIPDYIYIKDTNSRFLLNNQAHARLMGYEKAEDIQGKTDFDTFPPEFAAKYYEDEQELIQLGQSLINQEETAIDPQGRELFVLTTKVPVRDSSGNIMGFVGISRDITERKHLEAKLLQAQKMEAIGQLTAGIAHDFNNMLTAINGFAELMQMSLSSGDPLRPMADKIFDAGQRAANLVRQLLTFSRKQIVAPKIIELNAIVTGMDKMLERIIGEHIQMSANLAPGLWFVTADPSQMEQIIVNLAVNARDAMPSGGKLIIETANVVLDRAFVAAHLEAQPGPYVLLTISDTGVGMSEDVKAHLFEPFFTTKEPGKGTGLGLATIYGIIKQCEGCILVSSVVGQGTSFKIYLPRAQPADLPLASSTIVATRPTGRETILLTEDAYEVRDLVRRVLEELGYTVLVAPDGLAAIDVVNNYRDPIHLLLTDMVMPGLGGKALAEQLVQTRPGLKVIFMSGYADETIAHQGVLDSHVFLLQKPFSPLELAQKVREVLDGAENVTEGGAPD